MKLNEIKIAVLCGGKGVRLKPLTHLIPKALVILRDKPIIQHVLDIYSKQGIKEFTLCVNNQGNLIADYINTIENKPYSVNFLNSGDDASMLKRIYDLKDNFDEDIVITYGDTINNIDFKALLKFHKENKSILTIVSRDVVSPFGLLDIEQNKVKKFQEKPKLVYYIGTMVLSKKAFDYMDKDLIEQKDALGLINFLQKLIDLDLLHAYQHKGKDLTFNTKSQMLDAEEGILDFYYTLSENGLEK